MRNKLVAAALAIAGSTFGLHQFYLGRKNKGILYAFFFWSGVPTVVGLIDAAMLMGLSDEEFELKYNATGMRAGLAMQGENPYSLAQQQADFLLRLNEMRKNGIITQEQFEVARQNTLGTFEGETLQGGADNMQGTSYPPPTEGTRY